MLASGEAGNAIAPPTDEPGAVAGDADLALVKDTVQISTPTIGGENLSGKLNNLVTSDLDNITAGRDFLLVGTSDQICEGVVSDIMQDFRRRLRLL